MKKLNQIVKSFRVILLLIVLVLSIAAIKPNPWNTGVSIRGVLKQSVAGEFFENPEPTSSPMSRERIISMNNVPINNELDYYSFVDDLTYNRTVNILTNKGSYSLVTRPLYEVTILPELEEVEVEKVIQKNVTINGTTELVNETVIEIELVNKTISEIIGTEDLGFNIYNSPTTDIKKGLDLAGGTRVLLEPEDKLDSENFDILIENLKERLNVYGLSDIVVRSASDLSGNKFILVEIAGAKKDEVKDLISSQGKFEAKIGEDLVFGGGDDIKAVCRSPQCAGIDINRGCSNLQDGSVACRFNFKISLSTESAKRQADLTKSLTVVAEGNEKYLSKSLDLYLDSENVDTLRISSELQGRQVTDITISGSGFGKTREAAENDALQNMKRLQTILITGSLPSKLNVVQLTSISPSLGNEFLSNALLVGFLSICGVVVVVLARYRDLRIAIPMAITLFSEVIILLGFASLIGWNIDLAAIAGIVIVIGTSVDHQIVITDEILRGEGGLTNWKQRLKNAMFIIMGAYFTTVVAMFPLMRAGAGLLKGFAITTIIGVSIGVFITRPAFGKAAEILLKK